MQPYPPMGAGGPGQPGPYANPFPPRPPSSPRTLGTLSIVFGAIVAAFSLLGAVGGAGMAGMMAKGMPGEAARDAMQTYLQEIRTPSLIQGLVFMAMSVWLIVLGVGQRRFRAWAARQSVLWGVIALIILVGMVVVYITVTAPAAQRMMDAMAHDTGVRNPMGGFMSIGGVLGTVFYAPYPIILLVTFRKPSIVAAMTS